MFQSFALFPHLDVRGNLGFGLRRRGTPKPEVERRTQEMLALVGLEALADRYPSELSGGQQQRVAVARAVILRPPVLLMDEPLSSLDLKMRVQMRAEIRAIQLRLGLTLIYVTHDQDEALSMSDRVAVMAAGQVRQIGTPREIYDSPAGTDVASFIGSSNLLVVDEEGRTAEGLALSERRAGTASVRPERIAILAPEATRPDNVFEGVVEAVTFLGADVDAVVRIGPAARLSVSVKNSGTAGLVAGSPVTIGFGADDVVWLAA